MASIVCVRPCVPVSPMNISLPGVGPIQGVAQFNLTVGCSNCDALAAMMIAIQPYMASLGPIFCVMGCAGAMKDLASSLEDALGPPPDPSKITVAVANVVSKCSCLTTFLPANFFSMLCSMLTLADGILGCVSTLLGHIVTINAKANTLLTSSNTQTQQTGACLLGIASIQQETVMGKANVVGLFLKALEFMFAAIPGIPGSAIVDLKAGVDAFNGAVSGSPPVATILGAINTLKTVISTVKGAIACP